MQIFEGTNQIQRLVIGRGLKSSRERAVELRAEVISDLRRDPSADARLVRR